MSKRTASRKKLIDYYSSGEVENLTPTVAQIAEKDYHLNGGRARCNSGDFVGPRWVVDQEITSCTSCSKKFTWNFRRHHCRHCGMIFCDPCSNMRALLPQEFGVRDPQRVCMDCNTILAPLQRTLVSDIANHQRVNSVEIVPDSCTIRRYSNLPFSWTIGSEIRKATYSIYNLFHNNIVSDANIIIDLIKQAKGLAFLSVFKAGFIFAPRIGTGIIISRLSDGRWSAPSAIGTIGMSWGALIGADMTDHVIILNTDEAVEAFSGIGQVSIGVGIDVAVGPVGRNGTASINAGDGGIAPAFSYSHSRGLFAGVSLDGTVLFCRSDMNHRFYGRVTSSEHLLKGLVPPPRAAQPLYDALYEAVVTTSNPQHNKRNISI